MASMELALLIGLLIGQLALIILAQFKIAQIASSEVAGRIEMLNQSLGQAIQMVDDAKDGLDKATENPWVGLVSRIVDRQLDAPITATVLQTERDDLGKFVKKIE